MKMKKRKKNRIVADRHEWKGLRRSVHFNPSLFVSLSLSLPVIWQTSFNKEKKKSKRKQRKTSICGCC